MGARRSDEDCLVAVVGTGGSNVDHCLVHAYFADDAVEVVVDNYHLVFEYNNKVVQV